MYMLYAVQFCLFLQTEKDYYLTVFNLSLKKTGFGLFNLSLERLGSCQAVFRPNPFEYGAK